MFGRLSQCRFSLQRSSAFLVNKQLERVPTARTSLFQPSTRICLSKYGAFACPGLATSQGKSAHNSSGEVPSDASDVTCPSPSKSGTSDSSSHSSALCPYAESMYNELSRVLQAVLDPSAVNQRRDIYGQIYHLIRLNAQSAIKAKNLDALLYSKFKTTCVMVRSEHRHMDEVWNLDRDEEADKRKFKQLVQRAEQGGVSAAEFEEQYHAIILDGRSDTVKQAFVRMTSVINGATEADWLRQKDDFHWKFDMTAFYLASQIYADLLAFNISSDRHSSG